MSDAMKAAQQLLTETAELRDEIERLRAALQTVVDLAEDGILPDGHDLEDFRTLLKPSSLPNAKRPAPGEPERAWEGMRKGVS
jgi:hypothetical protein